MTIPIVRLEIQHMQQSVMTALTQYAARMDEDIQRAVKEACTPERIYAVVLDEACRCLDAAVREEMRNFYIRGDGRKYVREMVEKMLKESGA